MGRLHQHRVATSTMFAGLLIMLMSFGGSWGEAYGQTAGPTPTAGQRAVLSVTKQVDNANPRQGDIVSFTIRVQNTGSVAALNVLIRDILPGTFDVLRASATAGTVEVVGQVVTVSVPQIDPGVTVLAVIEARVRAEARGELRNTVTVRETTSGDSANELSATAVLQVAEQADASPPAGGDNRGGAGGDNRGGSNPLLSGTGAGSGLQLPLLVIGMMLVLIGGLVFSRVRSAQ